MQLHQVISTLKRNKATSLLVILQVALTLMIVSNAIFESLVSLELWQQPTGLDEERLIAVRYQVIDPNVNLPSLIEQDRQLLNNIAEIDETIVVSEIPLDSQVAHAIYLDNRQDAKEYMIEWFDSDENMLVMLGAKILEGRNFHPSEVVHISEDANSEAEQSKEHIAVVMVSEAFAQFAFGKDSAIGKTLWLNQSSEPVQVIGVYSNWLAGEELDNYHTMIRPKIVIRNDSQVNYFIKTNVTATQPLLEQINDLLYQTKGRYVSVVESLTRPKKRMYDGRTSHAFTMLSISAIAMVITALGIAGLISFSVNQRTRQIGIRRALGGTKKQIIHFFMLEISVLTSVGVVLGIMLMVIWNYILADQTGGRGSLQWLPLIYLIVGIYMVNALACWFPSKKAAQIDPAIVTRG